MNAEEAGMSDYLWDGTGPVDAAVARLESLLGGQRHAGMTPRRVVAARRDQVEEPGAPRMAVREASGQSGIWRRVAIAAMVAIVGVVGYMARPADGPTLNLELISGAPRIESAKAGGSIAVGQWLSTDSSAAAKIEIADIGYVTVRPNTRIMVRGTGTGSDGKAMHVLKMERGRIEAEIYAPPRVFLVDTPSARAIDMGCQYSLDVSEDGSGLLRVTLGHVILEGHGRSSDVPMLGGMCRTRKGFGPGTPYFDDASTELIGALEKFDFEGGTTTELDVVLRESRPRDGLSLWHLLSRTSGEDRVRVFEKLVDLKPLPESVSREEVLRLEATALERWHEHMRPF